MSTKPYLITDKAGPRMHDKPVKAGEVIELTDRQARHLLATGQIVPKPEDAEPEATKPSAPKKAKAPANDGD